MRKRAQAELLGTLGTHADAAAAEGARRAGKRWGPVLARKWPKPRIQTPAPRPLVLRPGDRPRPPDPHQLLASVRQL